MAFGQHGQGLNRSIPMLACLASASLAILLTGAVAPGEAGASEAPQPDRQLRIVNGGSASISDFPWQVALLDSRAGKYPRQQYFCTGSRIAEDLVITAAHCVTDFMGTARRKRLRVVSGRTVLNKTSQGISSLVEEIRLPRDANGKSKYRDEGGAAVWDVALLRLKEPVPGPVIKLAGQDEAGATLPGTEVQTTGWGITRGFGARAAKRLRRAVQVILPTGVCQRDNGRLYRPELMICLGGSRGHASACNGDSGGPLVSRTSGGRRLVGLTSFGDIACRGNVPSVDTGVSNARIRKWVKKTAIEVSGVDPVGAGGTPAPKPRWCKVPGLRNRSVSSARRALRARGCRIGKVRATRKRAGKVRRVVRAYLPVGWLTPVGSRVNVRITKR